MNEQQYRAFPATNWSALKHIGDSPAHYQWHLTHPPEDTPAMLMGRAVHCLVLEPERWAERYAVAPECDRRTRSGKALWAEFVEQSGGKDVLKQEDYDQARAMADAVAAHPLASAVISSCRREVVLQWTDEETGIHCKGRTDLLSSVLLGDLKTARSLDPHDWQRSVARSGYAAQLAMYHDGALAMDGRTRLVGIVAVEKAPPWDVGVFHVDDETLQWGRMRYRGLLRRLAECLETDTWPGRYPTETPITLPRWAWDENL